MIRRFRKDPAATLDYTLDWSQWLPPTDTIATSTWTAPTGLTITTNTHTGSESTVWLSGGTVNASYGVVNKITTAQGRVDERTIVIDVENR